MPDILDEIVAYKREFVEHITRVRSLADIKKNLSEVPPPPSFADAIRRTADGPLNVIAEVKKASPSKGMLAPDLDHRRVAKDYALGGATGISVLTEENYFLGSLEWMRDVRTLLSEMLPAQAMRAGGLWALKLMPGLRKQAFRLGMGAR